MSRPLAIVLGVGLCLGTALPAAAHPMTVPECRDYRGLPVAAVANPHISDVAVATLLPDGSPVIYFNPTTMQTLHPKTRLFFYAHECAHQALGHLPMIYYSLRRVPTIEVEADCYGIRLLAQTGRLGQDDLIRIQRDLAVLGQADWDHLPGPTRAFNLGQCLSGVRLRP
jgi:hypothetical protein